MSNNADKRSVSTDALETLGTIIDESQKRDAIRLAVIPVKAGMTLRRGTDVYLDGNTAYEHFSNDTKNKALGVVDPFLTEIVKEGEIFWLVIYPRKITSLRHVWTHPDVPEGDLLDYHADSEEPEDKKKVDEKAESEAWLRNFCATEDCPDYDTLIEALSTGSLHDPDGDGWKSFSWESDYLYFGGIDAHASIPPEFWDHVSNVLGYKINPANRAEYFSCSC